MKTLVVSTDPAHSLGDALGTSLKGQLIQLDSSMDGSGGELWAMEVDPTEALEEFRDTLKSTLGSNDTPMGGLVWGASMGLPDLKAELSDMLSGDGLADTPGADEVVASDEGGHGPSRRNLATKWAKAEIRSCRARHCSHRAHHAHVEHCLNFNTVCRKGQDF